MKECPGEGDLEFEDVMLKWVAWGGLVLGQCNNLLEAR